MDIDPHAKKIIKAKYWKNGWIDRAKFPLPRTDADYLTASGWDLGCMEMTHDEVVAEVVEISSRFNVKSCVSLCSRSLASGNVEDRSFLSSVLQAQRVPEHSHSESSQCRVCGLYGKMKIDQDVLLFEKVMWGGVRLTDLTYIWLDLKLLERGYEKSSDVGDLKQLLDDMAALPQGLSASKFANALKMVKGNKAQREKLCGILGLCDMLQHPDHPGMLDQYRNLSHRDLPNQAYIDLEWPFCWYNSNFGVNHEALKKLTSPSASKVLKRTALG